jgi:hypothetical protein
MTTDAPNREIEPGSLLERTKTRGLQMRRRRRLKVASLCAALLAMLAVVVVLVTIPVSPPASHVTGERVGPSELVSFTASNGEIVAKITRPLAAASQLQAAFRSHGLDVTVVSYPVSPSLVGQILTVTTNVRVSPVRGRPCLGGGYSCVVGIKLPTHFTGYVVVSVGRFARPGEAYTDYGGLFDPGDPLHCSGLLGESVRAALPGLRSIGMKIEWGGPGGTSRPPKSGYIVDGGTPSVGAIWLQVDSHPITPRSPFYHGFVMANRGC